MAKDLAERDAGIVDLIHLPFGARPRDRFDAYRRMVTRHGRTAFDRAHGRQRSHESNHAMDLNMLMHLADRLVLVTADYELVEEVDASGSKQAPWVRTLGEMLTCGAPPGPPFAERARIESGKHRKRNRADLEALDKKVIASLRR